MHFFNMKKTKNWLRKVMHSFEVHSNESACRKKVRIGLEQVKMGSRTDNLAVTEEANFDEAIPIDLKK